VNGSVLAFAGDVVVVGVLLVVAGSTVLAGGVVVGVFVDFDGDVPLFGSGFLAPDLLYVLVAGSAARADATGATPRARTTGRIKSPRRARDDPLLVVPVGAACGLLEAMTLVRVMPTSRSFVSCGPSGPLAVICPLILLAKRLPCS
jgi:hypothetical protein